MVPRDNEQGPPGEDHPPFDWVPSESERTESNIARLMSERGIGSYKELHAWSIRERTAFWAHVIRKLGIVFARRPDSVLDDSKGVANPCWLPGAKMNITESCFNAPPGSTAILFGREGSDRIDRVSFGELEAGVARFAGALAAAGFRAGEAIALYMPMNVECVTAYLGIVRAGCRVVSVPDSFPAAELKRRLAIGGARAIVTVDRFHRAGKEVTLYDKVIEAGAPRAIVVPDGDVPAVPLRDGDLSWNDFTAGHPPAPPVAVDADHVSNVLFSSGTTGDPKAIPWTHLTPIKCAMDGRYHQDIRPGDVVAWPTNIGWMMGPWLIYASLINGAAMALYGGIPAGPKFARFVEKAGVTMLGVIPSLVRAWRRGGLAKEFDWSAVRLFSSTGEPSGRSDYRWLISLAGAPVIEYCGGTEIGGGYITGTVVQGASASTFSTPALGLDFRLLDDEGNPAGIGRSGEVFLVPPSIGLSQSLLNADHHAIYHGGCPAGPGGEILRRHGDQVERLPGGYFRAAGRADDTMNLGGIKVSAVELERLADEHESIRECAAISVRVDEGPEKLVLFAVPEGGEVSAKDLRKDVGALLAARLNPLFKVHDLVLVDSLPRTASNKLMRRKLRDGYGSR